MPLKLMVALNLDNLGRRVFSRWDRSSDEAIRSKLGNNYTVNFRTLLLYMNGIIRLFIDSVTAPRVILDRSRAG